MDTNSTIDKAAAGAHGAVDRAANAASQAAEKVKPVISRATDAAHSALDKAAGLATPAADWLGSKTDAVRAAPEKLVESGRDLVVSHPWKALGAAVVLGLLISRILR